MKVWESHVAFGTQTRPFNDPLLVLYSVLGPRLDPCGAEPSFGAPITRHGPHLLLHRPPVPALALRAGEGDRLFS